MSIVFSKKSTPAMGRGRSERARTGGRPSERRPQRTDRLLVRVREIPLAVARRHGGLADASISDHDHLDRRCKRGGGSGGGDGRGWKRGTRIDPNGVALSKSPSSMTTACVAR